MSAPPRARTTFSLEQPLLAVAPWPDALLDELGYDPRSRYVERYWLPILGPTTTLLIRYLATRFDDEPEGFHLDIRDTARRIGVGVSASPTSPFARTLERLVSFGFAQLVDQRVLVVRSHLPSLTRRQLLRLPASLQREHDRWEDEHRARTQPEALRHRARALALSLFELGEDYDATERQLHRWQFHPAIAHDAVRWAATEHLARANGRATTSPTAPAATTPGPDVSELAERDVISPAS